MNFPNAPGSQKRPCTGIRRIERKLRSDEYGIGAGSRDLFGHLLPGDHVALECRSVPVEKYHHDRRAADVIALGNVQQHARVVVGLVLPIDTAEGRAMAQAPS